MDIIKEFFGKLTDIKELVRWAGYPGLAMIVFSETGLLVGFFLPGDSLLVTAGLFAAAGFFDIKVLIMLLIPARDTSLAAKEGRLSMRVKNPDSLRESTC